MPLPPSSSYALARGGRTATEEASGLLRPRLVHRVLRSGGGQSNRRDVITNFIHRRFSGRGQRERLSRSSRSDRAALIVLALSMGLTMEVQPDDDADGVSALLPQDGGNAMCLVGWTPGGAMCLTDAQGNALVARRSVHAIAETIRRRDADLWRALVSEPVYGGIWG